MTHTTTLASAGTNYTAIGVLLAIFVPICAAVAVIVWNYYRLQRHRADAVALASYRKLAEEAVANMTELRGEMTKLAENVSAVEQLYASRGVSAVGKLSLRRDPIRLVLSRDPWVAAWYLLGHLVVGWALFAIALSTAVAGVGLNITLAGLPVLVAAAAAIRWCADVERARLRPLDPAPGAPPAGHRGTASWPSCVPRWRDPAIWRDVAYLVGMFVPLLALDAIVLAVWWGFLAGITLPIWYWAPWQTIHGVRYHGYDLGYHPQGPARSRRPGPLRQHAPGGVRGRGRLPGAVPDLQLRRGGDRPRPRSGRPRTARPGGRPAVRGEGGTQPSRPARAELPRPGAARFPGRPAPPAPGPRGH